ncbi:MAG: SVM family protein [Phytoplasma sp.]|uniref:SVM family protein n=1 Tax=Phytoplasma sp. TaxID=2155 RepID=UPI002B414712|nr:SVM family protein [Phytoplasma sp.]WRH06821.1 MAG: SVM family protein [Phytoplasma sp.]
MVKLKKQFKTIYFCLIAFIGLLFLFNNHQVMAMENTEINLSLLNTQKIKTFYKININENYNNSLKMSYYVSDKNSSLQSVSHKINVINSIAKPTNNKNNCIKLQRNKSI